MDDYDEDSRSRSRSRSAERKRSKGGRKKQRKDKRHKKSRHKRRRDESDEDESTSSMSSDYSSASSYHRHHSKKRKRSKDSKKKHRRKKDRKHRRHKRSRDNHGRSRSSSASKTAPIIPTAPPGAHELANALTKLFTIYPNMASIDEGGIPILFIQLSRGTEYNLTHMPDKHLAGLLEEVFQSLRIHGMELLSSGAWKWGNAAGNDLALLRLTRALLNGVDINMDTIQKYESLQHQQHLPQTQQQQCQDQQSQMKNGAEIGTTQDEDTIKQKKRIERLASQLLSSFDRPEDNGTSTPASLANELIEICDAILEGESIQLDGIENAKLKASLAQLFELAGLELVEMEDDDDDDDDEESTASNPDDNEDTAAATQNAMGYALPESNVRDSISSNVREVLRVCRFRSTNCMECAPTSWAATKTLSTKAETQPESSDEDDGPAPLGTIEAAKAAKRKRPSETSNTALAGAEKEGGREEWMMVPGEHDFLKGISKSNFRGRTFKNSKSKSAAAPAAETVNPVVLAEVQAIQQAYEESRGPSLLDAHRQNKKEKQEGNKKQEWKWSREKNLDDGRRVDKNALHLVLGGAKTELKSKFQSGNGR